MRLTLLALMQILSKVDTGSNSSAGSQPSSRQKKIIFFKKPDNQHKALISLNIGKFRLFFIHSEQASLFSVVCYFLKCLCTELSTAIVEKTDSGHFTNLC